MEYILITFYNKQTEENPSWEVYGHKAPYNNDFIDSFKTRSEAIDCALKYSVPIMQGANKYHIVEKLYDK